MAVTQFKDVTWANDEPISTDKLNTMASNTRYLFERMPKLYYNAFNVQKDTGVKIACGVAVIPPSKSAAQYIQVNFGSFFTPGCKPVVSTNIASPLNGRIIDTMFSLDGTYNPHPDHRGFTSRLACTELAAKDNYFMKTMYLHWIAVGY